MQKYENQSMPDEARFYLDEDNSISDGEVFRRLVKAKRENETLIGYCHKCLGNGDLEIELSKNIKGVIPREEVTYKVERDGEVHLGKCMSRVGMYLQFKIKELKEEDGELNVILSRKEAVREIRERYKKELKPGMIVKGVVTGIQSWGAFIDIGGDVDGIIGVADVARVFIKNPSEVLSMGKVVEVVIDEINKVGEDIQLVLNRKVLLPDFDQIEKYYKAKETVKGRVKKIIDSGIFVELNDAFEGLAEFLPDREFKYGETVRVKIHSINKEKKKIRLRILG